MQAHFLLFSSFFLTANLASAAACCGGGFAAPSLISGDDKAQVTSSYSYNKITDDVGADSLWRKRDSLETSETLKIEGAHIFRDRWQAGFSVPVVRRTRGTENSTGLGDLAATLGYEYLPDWDYNPWRPKGIGYLQLTLPSGRSVQESDTTNQLDARGRGFWAVGAGTLLTKIVGRWDLFANLDVHRSFEKNSHVNGGTITLQPGYGGNFGLGLGYNWALLRLGGALTWSYEDPVDVSGTVSSEGSPQRYATAALSASYMLPEEWAVTGNYLDQTVFGAPVNTSLGRGVMIYLQKRWLR